MKQVFNPFLPSYEYIPDGEPHVFGDRVYLYGSHDKFNGRYFCMNDYVCYSADVNDLSDWRYEGVIWRRKDDPTKRRLFLDQLYAPDVVEGTDGRYYLYYFIAAEGIIGVAVCDTPCGKFSFHGYVKYPNGKLLGRNNEQDFWQFDPGVFRDDDGSVYLYTGFGPDFPNLFSHFKPINSKGAMGVKLASDMLTVDSPLCHIGCSKHNGKGTAYEGHEFFEASSMRKFDGKYYFIYSGTLGHELCYAVSDSPLGNFTYGGTLVSIGDVGISDFATNYLGNTHGSVEKINGKYYVFYHRQTNRHCHSRQACAEQIQFVDGKFIQAEVTSCGLNGGALQGKGRYEARIACNLWSKKGVRFYTVKFPRGCHPYFTQSGVDRECDGDQHIANFCNGATAGFKYFDCNNVTAVGVNAVGNARGVIEVRTEVNGQVVATIPVSPCKERTDFVTTTSISGIVPLYFTFSGKGAMKLYEIILD